MMKERPILMSGVEVGAILAGRQTQMRRVCKSPIWLDMEDVPSHCTRYGDVAVAVKCPYGEPGDRLWVRETHFEARKWRHAPLFAAAPDFIYRADYEYRDDLRSVIGCHHWRPSIFMKREASRIMLEIVSVRVERQEISEGDNMPQDGNPKSEPTARRAFERLWRSINGPESWAANPWVWVVEFKRL